MDDNSNLNVPGVGPTTDRDNITNIVTLADLQAAVGVEPIPPGQSTGVIYDSDAEFLTHLRSQPASG